MACCILVFDLPSQTLNKALEELNFTPDYDSNALNVDGLASLKVTVNDLGLSGEGGAQQSEPLIVHLVIEAVNDGPLLHLPDHLAAQEDIPLFISGISVSDADSDEHGGRAAKGSDETSPCVYFCEKVNPCIAQAPMTLATTRGKLILPAQLNFLRTYKLCVQSTATCCYLAADTNAVVHPTLPLTLVVG